VRAIRTHARAFAAILGLVAVAAVVSLYITSNQRLRFPWEPKPYTLQAEFSTAQAVVAGQGQTVRVSGVRIGDVGDVQLEDGRAVVRMDIDPQYRGMIHTDATALLRPRTGLKDMFVELRPGSAQAPVARDGWTLPIAATAPDVNLDEVLSMLDADTRDYLKLLVSDAGRGLKGRGADLREIFARFQPTHRDIARVNTAIATRRQNLERLIRSLNLLNGELASRGKDLTGLVASSEAVLRQFAAEQANVSSAVSELPGALRQTTDTLHRVQSFADVLGPTARKLVPAALALPAANASIIPLAKQATPQLRDDIRPFVREARPVVRDLRPSSDRLAVSTPNLTRAFKQINALFNMLGYNPNGREAPSASRQEGYLFWLAWLQHNGIQVFSTSDAHGVFRPVTIASPCASIQQIATEQAHSPLPYLENLVGLLTDSHACGNK
jgi:phospholipid/cholesterol/gamma-HCH transport system substrate-binding protein